MAIKCPYCQHTIGLKGLHSGHFTPKCPLCKKRFSLDIPADESAPTVSIIVETPAPTPSMKKGSVADEIAEALGLELPKPKPKAKPRAMALAAAGGQAPPQTQMQVQTQTQRQARTSVAPSGVNVTSLPPEAAAAEKRVNTPKPADPPPPDAGQELRGSLGGYDIVQKLGQGGMGAVYLARQVSLDRNVALKVMNPTWASDPIFVARFTREAFAAAQLTHHNVVQIHDIGEDQRQQFFSMEFVEGMSLADVIKDKGRVDNETAVGYVLQAARGLKFAHDHGMVHRDVKPENLLLNDEGIVKVADLGLVKTPNATIALTNAPSPHSVAATAASPDAPGREEAMQASQLQKTGGLSNHSGNVTQLNVSMGTPLYMAPEQATNAAGVDARADIYSLGCTLYHLLVGRPPFVGNSSEEVIGKHQTEPVVPPDKLIKRVTPNLSGIVVKMMAKNPAERYANMSAVIRDLEGLLGVAGGKPFAPDEEDMDDLERESGIFNSASWARLRNKLVYAFFGITALAILGAFVLGHPLLGGGLVGFGLLTTVFYVLVQGMMQKTFLFTKIRQLVFGARIFDWLMWLVGLAILAGVLFVLDLHLAWLGFAVLAAGAATGFYFALDLLVAKQRSYPIRAVQEMLKGFRIKGLDEEALRAFVAKFSGQNWEEFYEALFGYEDKMLARQRWGKGESGKDRPRYAAWRDAVIGWIDHRMHWRQEKKQGKFLRKIESRKLAAEGIEKAEARKKGRKVAEKLLHRAQRLKEESSRRLAETVAAATMMSPKMSLLDAVQVVRPMYDDDGHATDDAGERKHASYLQRKYGGPVGLIVGPHVRFALAAILLAGFVAWLYQNKSIPMQEAGTRAVQEFAGAHDALSGESNYYHDPVKPVDPKVKFPTRNLQLSLVPDRFTALFSTYNTGIAGALLILSCLFSGARLGFFMIPAAGLIFAGHLLPGVPVIPLIERFSRETIHATPLLAGAALGLLGLLVARK